MSIKEIFLLITLFFSRNTNKNVDMEKLKTSTDGVQSTEEIFCDLQNGDVTQNLEEEVVAKDIISENIVSDSIENSRIRGFLVNKKLSIGAATTFVALVSAAGILSLHQNKKNKEKEKRKVEEEQAKAAKETQRLQEELKRQLEIEAAQKAAEEEQRRQDELKRQQEEETRKMAEEEKKQIREAAKRRKRENARRRQQKNLNSSELGNYWR